MSQRMEAPSFHPESPCRGRIERRPRDRASPRSVWRRSVYGDRSVRSTTLRIARLAHVGVSRQHWSRLPTDEVRSTSDLSQTISVQTVILQTGTAPFDTTQQMGSAPAVRGYGYISIRANGVLLPCKTATSIRVVLPGFRTSIVVNLEVPGDFPEGQVFCSGGRSRCSRSTHSPLHVHVTPGRVSA